MAVYKRGEYFWTNFRINGQRIRVSTRETTKRKAQELERKMRIELKDQQKPRNKTYGEAVLKWIDTEAPDSMRSHIRNTLPYLQDVELHNVPAESANMVKDFRKRELSVQTINRRLACVKRVLNLAYKQWDWLDHPIAQKIPKYSEAGTEREIYLTEAEFKDLINAVESPVARAVIMIAAYTGLRRSEILNLRPNQYVNNHFVLDTKTKSGKRRSVPVIQELDDLIQLPFEITHHELRKAFESARETVKMPHVRLHDLRHTFASWLISNPDIPMKVVQELLGHSSLAVTSKYSHLRGSHLTLIQGALGGKSK